ncbi:MAG: hypothetical protein V4702_02135 [Patescibacteria group bacterium]
MLSKLLGSVAKQKAINRDAELYRNLIRHEAKIGGQVFGPVPAGVRREFFCLDEHTWVWHEEWRDAKGQQCVRTTRYDVRPDGILKAQGGQYQRLNAREAGRLGQAVEIYMSRVKNEMYANLA